MTDAPTPLSDEALREVVSVKPLEWPDAPRRGQRVRSGRGLLGYTIAYYGGDDPALPAVYRWAADDSSWSSALLTYDDAQAAAQLDYETRILSTLSLRSERAGWQPIETAPRDGTRILLFRDGDYADGQWLAHSGEWGNARRRWSYPATLAPTHWQPLPSSPRGDERG